MEDRSISASDSLSLFLLSSTSCGSKSGFNFGDILVDRVVLVTAGIGAGGKRRENSTNASLCGCEAGGGDWHI